MPQVTIISGGKVKIGKGSRVGIGNSVNGDPQTVNAFNLNGTNYRLSSDRYVPDDQVHTIGSVDCSEIDSVILKTKVRNITVFHSDSSRLTAYSKTNRNNRSLAVFSAGNQLVLEVKTKLFNFHHDESELILVTPVPVIHNGNVIDHGSIQRL